MLIISVANGLLLMESAVAVAIALLVWLFLILATLDILNISNIVYVVK
tara:strand:+ start:1986 stop:2129 length:144 start_codon:yes stop_codon:yes gene_type:complete